MHRLLHPKYSFILGAIIDLLISISWFLIAGGMELPNILSGYKGSGTDYQFSMCVAAMFMFGWSLILAWGAFKPIERVDLLLITAIMLLLSVIIELSVFSNTLGGGLFILGALKRLVLVVVFLLSFFLTKSGNFKFPM